MKPPIFVGLSTAALMAAVLVNGQTPAPKKSAPAAKPAVATPAKPAASSPKPASAAKPATSAAAAANPAGQEAADPIVIQVGDTKITKSQYEGFLAGLPEQIREQAVGPNKKRVAEQFAELKMMASEARKRGIDDRAKMKQQIEFQVDQLLASTLFSDMREAIKVDDAAVQAYYDAHKNEYEEAKARHILIRFEGSRVPMREGQKELKKEEALAKAKELKTKIDAGASLAELAKTESDDTGSGANGGDLGFFSRGQMVAQFEEAAFAQPVGKVGEPVESPFGYHLILVEEKKAKSLADQRKEIEAKLKPELAKKEVEAIRKTTPITLNDGYFGQ